MQSLKTWTRWSLWVPSIQEYSVIISPYIFPKGFSNIIHEPVHQCKPFSICVGPFSPSQSIPRTGCTHRQTSSILSPSDEKSLSKWSCKDFESPHKGEEWAGEKLCCLTHCQHPGLWRTGHRRVSEIYVYIGLIGNKKFCQSCSSSYLAVEFLTGFSVYLNNHISWVNWLCQDSARL